jgi:hypothetical protein
VNSVEDKVNAVLPLEKKEDHDDDMEAKADMENSS